MLFFLSFFLCMAADLIGVFILSANRHKRSRKQGREEETKITCQFARMDRCRKFREVANL
jgi:hypothetical protein